MRVRPTIEERFWARVHRTATCWLWIGSVSRKGYGMFHADEIKCPAHRFAYTLLVGPVPLGLEIDHLCEVRHCVNPAHLEPVTHAENLRRRGRWLSSAYPRRTPLCSPPCDPPLLRITIPPRAQCDRGHAYTPENTYYYPRGSKAGRRECRTCRAMRRPPTRYRRGQWRADMTHCKRGHEFTPANTILKSDGARECRACLNERKRAYRARKQRAVDHTAKTTMPDTSAGAT